MFRLAVRGDAGRLMSEGLGCGGLECQVSLLAQSFCCDIRPGLCRQVDQVTALSVSPGSQVKVTGKRGTQVGLRILLEYSKDIIYCITC